MSLRAVLFHQSPSADANLIWGPPLEADFAALLDNSIKEFRSLGYSMGAFREGDGLAFSHERYDSAECLNALKQYFQWLEIEVPTGSANEAIGELYAGKFIRTRYLVPVDKLLQLPDLIKLGPYKIHRPVMPGERPAYDHPCHGDLLDIPGADIDPDWDPTSAGLAGTAWLLGYPLIEGETDIDGRLFFPVGAGTSENEPLIMQITDHADRALDVLRHNFCHYKTPHFTPNQAGVLSGLEFRVAFIEPKLACIPERLVMAKGQVFEGNNVWLGLELDSELDENASKMATIAAGSVSNDVEGRIRSALRMRGQSFFLLNDEMRFVSLVFAADACALVGHKKAAEHRKHIAAFASFGRKSSYDKHLSSISNLYKTRNAIVHQGASFGELGVDSKTTLMAIDRIVCCCIESALQEKWTTEVEVKIGIQRRIAEFES